MTSFSDANGGRGFGVIRTAAPLDREERRHLMLPILVSDSGVPKQTATLTFTIALQDVNDNRMRSATKYVVAHIVQVFYLFGNITSCITRYLQLLHYRKF